MNTRFSNSRCLIAALVMAATLTPLGTRLGEAQGRRSESLQVAIPTGGFNLTGFCSASDSSCYFMDEGLRGLVQAELSTAPGKAPSHVFRLLLDPLLVGSGVKFNGVAFGTPTELKATYCEFGSTEFGDNAPACLEAFLMRDSGFPTPDYRFELLVATKNLDKGPGTLFLYFDAHPQTVELPDERHSVRCQSSDDVTVSSLGDTSWTTSGSVTLTCREYVYVRGKVAPKSYNDWRMTATTTRAFNFQIVWTK